MLASRKEGSSSIREGKKLTKKHQNKSTENEENDAYIENMDLVLGKPDINEATIEIDATEVAKIAESESNSGVKKQTTRFFYNTTQNKNHFLGHFMGFFYFFCHFGVGLQKNRVKPNLNVLSLESSLFRGLC